MCGDDYRLRHVQSVQTVDHSMWRKAMSLCPLVAVVTATMSTAASLLEAVGTWTTVVASTYTHFVVAMFLQLDTVVAAVESTLPLKSEVRD